MLGNLVLIGVSWLLFYFEFKKSIIKSWLFPVKDRLKDIGIGTVIALIAFLIPFLIKNLIYSSDWQINEATSTFEVLNLFYYFFNSVLFEELIFRGALLAILIHYLSPKKGILISAIVFGIYHWFSYGMFGAGIIPMLYIFLLTGGMGLVWAMMYSKTNSIVLPVTVHLGWNFQSALLADYQPFGNLLVSTNATKEFPELTDFGIQLGGDILAICLMVASFLFYSKKTIKPNLSERLPV